MLTGHCPPLPQQGIIPARQVLLGRVSVLHQDDYVRSNAIRIRWVHSPPDGRAGQGTGACSRGKCEHVTWTLQIEQVSYMVSCFFY